MGQGVWDPCLPKKCMMPEWASLEIGILINILKLHEKQCCSPAPQAGSPMLLTKVKNKHALQNYLHYFLGVPGCALLKGCSCE